MHAGTVMTGSGLWAGVAVCFIGPRDSTRAGGTFRTGILRAGGTVCGSMWGYLVGYFTSGMSEPGWLLYPLLAVWVFFCGFVRVNPSTAYGAQVCMHVCMYVCMYGRLAFLYACLVQHGVSSCLSYDSRANAHTHTHRYRNSRHTSWWRCLSSGSQAN